MPALNSDGMPSAAGDGEPRMDEPASSDGSVLTGSDMTRRELLEVAVGSAMSREPFPNNSARDQASSLREKGVTPFASARERFTPSGCDLRQRQVQGQWGAPLPISP